MQLTCHVCGREGSRGFTDDNGEPMCTNREQCTKRLAKAQRAKLADRCVDCLESGEDPKGARKLALKDDGTRQPGPRCVTHHRARRKDVSAQAHAKRIEATYELSAELYWALYQAQDGKCFICRKATGKTKRLAVEHDHELAKEHGHDPEHGCIRCIRALCCGRCNRLVAFLDVEALQRAIELLTDPPARKILCPPEPALADLTADELAEWGERQKARIDHAVGMGHTPDEIESLPLLDEPWSPFTDDGQLSTEVAGDWIDELADQDGIPAPMTLAEFLQLEVPAGFWFDPVD